MKLSNTIIGISLLLTLILTACFSKAPPEMTFYLVSGKQQLNSREIGCKEYLIPVKKTLEKKANLQEILQTLLTASPKEYGADFTTATAIGDRYIMLDKVEEPEGATYTNPGLVYLKTDPAKGLAGVCDTPRVKEQINQTIAEYSILEGKPFKVLLNGSAAAWTCFGDVSGLCK